ncbi:MAG: hypothetical protein NC200_05885 [Candidatus Gastranaerophilales bacterium]|nr:hypothetical protein [Candidatus Gastranaerophilales bacterium]
MNIAPISASISYTSTTQTKTTDTNNKFKTNINPVKLTGNLTLGLLGATAITGYAHWKKAHNLSIFLTAASALAHVISLNPHKKQKQDFIA